MKSDGEGREDGGRVGAAIAFESFRPYARCSIAESDAVAGKKRQLSGAMGKPFKSGKAVKRGHLADRVHLRMDVERRQSRCTFVEVGDAVTELLADVIERTCH